MKATRLEGDIQHNSIFMALYHVNMNVVSSAIKCYHLVLMCNQEQGQEPVMFLEPTGAFYEQIMSSATPATDILLNNPSLQGDLFPAM